VPQVASPMRFTEAALPQREAPPLLGQHSTDILAEIGYDAEAVRRLQADGAI